MGRLNDQAKHRIVVLRKAGLSFRKIKKVLELDNIKVTPQAIYLFLKRKNIEPVTSSGPTQSSPTKGQPWEQAHLWNLLQENGGQSKDQCPQAQKGGQASNDIRQQDDKEEGIKIVSVTSLSKSNPSLEPPTSAPRTVPQGQTAPQCQMTPQAQTVPQSQTAPQAQTVPQSRAFAVRPAQHPAVNGPRPNPTQPASHYQLHGRARTPLPSAKNPALLVTKKIVDRAISLQKRVISQNGVQLLNHGGQYPLPATGHQHAARAVAKPRTQLKDVSTQTAPAPFPPAMSEASAKQLDSVRGELHRLTQVMQTLIERQGRWEQEQMRQRQCNHQEVLTQIQQLGATLVTKLSQSCMPFGSAQEPEAPLPDFGHFKMELL